MVYSPPERPETQLLEPLSLQPAGPPRANQIGGKRSLF